MSQIVTFYSYKGGVGRSMALANIAVLLAQRDLRVLAVDWDLEAPGLERYFDYFDLSIKRGGLLPFLVEQHAQLGGDGEPRADHYRHHLWTIDVGGEHPLSLLGSGRAAHADYARVLEQFEWTAFFKRGGGDFLEQLRDHWRADFDIVLIDSRTGVSDAGGICTIQMPDVLVAMFTASYQSVLGVRDVIQSAQAARQRLAYDRMALTVLPLPSRLPRGGDSQPSNEWLDRIATELGGCLAEWLPRGIEPRSVLERLIIPHRDEFALGERLAVAEPKTPGARALTTVYKRIAELLAAEFRDIEAALGAIEPAPVSRSASRAIEELALGRRQPAAIRPDVFVSYPRAGSVLREWVYRFVEALGKASGTKIGMLASFFLDVEDRPDSEFDQVRPILDRSHVLLAILTPHYLASSWCLAEWQAFEDRERAEGRTLIVPVALRGVSALPGWFSERAMIDGSGVDLSDASGPTMARLVERTLKKLAVTLEGAPRSGRAPDRQPMTAPTHRSVKPARQRRKILLLAANPLSTGRLALEVEMKEISLAIDRSRFRDQTEVVAKWSTDLGDLVRTLHEVTPAVVHFGGHGASDGLYLTDPKGFPQLLSGEYLARVIQGAGRSVRLVVLNACYSEKLAAALSEIVDCVVGTVASTPDDAAVAFLATFYEALAAGQSVDHACEAGRTRILLRADMERRDEYLRTVSDRWGEDPGAMVQLRTRRGVSADTVFLTTQPRTLKAPSGKRRAGTRRSSDRITPDRGDQG